MIAEDNRKSIKWEENTFADQDDFLLGFLHQVVALYPWFFTRNNRDRNQITILK